ncbi:hypothetical protein FOA52_012637 [Chlamydomonas sp. UWO 241]|nr:hypothetical protein FOA52_012637 [Chlamydomonas sp. UWO 241]
MSAVTKAQLNKFEQLFSEIHRSPEGWWTFIQHGIDGSKTEGVDVVKLLLDRKPRPASGWLGAGVIKHSSISDPPLQCNLPSVQPVASVDVPAAIAAAAAAAADAASGAAAQAAADARLLPGDFALQTTGVALPYAALQSPYLTAAFAAAAAAAAAAAVSGITPRSGNGGTVMQNAAVTQAAATAPSGSAFVPPDAHPPQAGASAAASGMPPPADKRRQSWPGSEVSKRAHTRSVSAAQTPPTDVGTAASPDVPADGGSAVPTVMDLTRTIVGNIRELLDVMGDNGADAASTAAFVSRVHEAAVRKNGHEVPGCMIFELQVMHDNDGSGAGTSEASGSEYLDHPPVA